jgi:NTE family protein
VRTGSPDGEPRPIRHAGEIARRHRFASDLVSNPDGVDVHVLPTGATVRKYNDPMKLKYRDLSRAEANIESAYNATLLHPDHIPD